MLLGERISSDWQGLSAGHVSRQLFASGFGPNVGAVHNLAGCNYPYVLILPDQLEQRIVCEIVGVKDPTLIERLAHDGFLDL